MNKTLEALEELNSVFSYVYLLSDVDHIYFAPWELDSSGIFDSGFYLKCYLRNNYKNKNVKTILCIV